MAEFKVCGLLGNRVCQVSSAVFAEVNSLGCGAGVKIRIRQIYCESGVNGFPTGLMICGNAFASTNNFEPKELEMMNSLPDRYLLAVATGAMSLMLAGCHESPPPTTVVNPPAASSAPAPTTMEHTTTSTEVKETKPAPANPDGTPATADSQTTTTQKTTTVEKKKE